jgi:hypothetical protein
MGQHLDFQARSALSIDIARVYEPNLTNPVMNSGYESDTLRPCAQVD